MSKGLKKMETPCWVSDPECETTSGGASSLNPSLKKKAAGWGVGNSE